MSLILILCCIVASVTAFLPQQALYSRQRGNHNNGILRFPPSLKSTATPRNNNGEQAAAAASPALNQTLVEVSTASSTTDTQASTTDKELLLSLPVESETLLQTTSTPFHGNGKTAIVLNVNARSVTPDLTDVAQHVFGEANVYLTTTEDQARQAAHDIVEHNYSLVIPVGGDGTLSTLLSMMVSEILQQNNTDTENELSVDEAMTRLPLVGYIPLGTGNGVGSVVGCFARKPSFWKRLLPGRKQRRHEALRDLFERLKYVAQHPQETSDTYDLVELPMMQVTMENDNKEETTSDNTQSKQHLDLCFFAGVGFDSLMLNDFKQIKAWSKRTGVFTKLLSSVTGYCVALVVKTLPKCVVHGKHNINVEVTTREPHETAWIDHRRGDVMRRVSGEQLYKGKTGILAAGTSPFYGGGLRLFPFARMTLDKMHLRLGRIHPLTGFVNIPAIFQGSYRDTTEENFGCIDFVGSDFDIAVDEGFPFQHSGESLGHFKSFRLSVIKEPVKFVTFWKKSWHKSDEDEDEGA